MKSIIHWMLRAAVVLLLALSADFGWLWRSDSQLVNNNVIFGPKMFWQSQQQLMERLFFISATLTVIVVTIVVVKSKRH